MQIYLQVLCGLNEHSTGTLTPLEKKVMVSESLSYLTAVGKGSYAASSKTGVILGFRVAEGALSWLFACWLRV